MTFLTAMKLGQIVGVLLLAAGFACVMMAAGWGSEMFILGTLLYAGCRLTVWLRSDQP